MLMELLNLIVVDFSLCSPWLLLIVITFKFKQCYSSKTLLLGRDLCCFISDICYLANGPVYLWRWLRTLPLTFVFHFQWQTWDTQEMSQMVTIIHLGVTQQLKLPMATTFAVIHLRIITLQVVRWSTRNQCEQSSFTTTPSTTQCCFTTAHKTEVNSQSRPMCLNLLVTLNKDYLP